MLHQNVSQTPGHPHTIDSRDNNPVKTHTIIIIIIHLMFYMLRKFMNQKDAPRLDACL